MATRFDDVRRWAAERNLIEGSTPQAQMLKLLEELGELAGGVAKSNQAAALDGAGDVLVVLTILAEQLGFRIEEALDAAWEEIKDRKGRMVDGVFVKESDLLIDTLGLEG